MNKINTKREYQRCTNCIMDTTDPEIEFYDDGGCNHCRYYENWHEYHMNQPKSREERQAEMVAEIKGFGKGKEYDCIMGLSGGVDSSWLSWHATQNLGLRVMAVHVDAGWNSELAVNNIENIVKKLNIDLHTIVIDWEEIRDLQRAFFKASVPNCDTPQDHAFFAALYKEAIKFDHKHVLTGGNMATESILPRYWGYDAMDYIHMKDIHRKYGAMKLKRFPTFNFYEQYIKFPLYYKFKVHRPIELVDYDKAEAKKFLMDELDWRDYGGKHYESKFTHFFQAHYLPEKYGFDKRLAHLSSMIVSGQMTREEALAEMTQPLYEETALSQDREFFIKKLGFSREEWDQIMNDPPKTEHDYKNHIKRLAFLNKLRVGMYMASRIPYKLLSLPRRILSKIKRVLIKFFK